MDFCKRDINLHKNGYMTVEAVFVMIVVIAVIAFIICSGFFLCDRCVISGAVYEGSVWGANKKAVSGTVTGSEMSAEAKNHAATTFFDSVLLQGDDSINKTQITANADRKIFSIPLLSKMMKNPDWNISVGASCYCPDKERIIRLTKAVIQLKDKV